MILAKSMSLPPMVTVTSRTSRVAVFWARSLASCAGSWYWPEKRTSSITAPEQAANTNLHGGLSDRTESKVSCGQLCAERWHLFLAVLVPGR